MIKYDDPSQDMPVKQGEILYNLAEIIPVITASTDPLNSAETKPMYIVRHPFTIVASQACDILQDWKERNETQKTGIQSGKAIITHIQLCDLFEESEIRASRGLTSELWKRVKQNQDERYHHLDEASVNGKPENRMPNLYADFKRVFAVPIEYLYWTLSKGYTTRKALLLDPYLRDLIDRLYNYLSRVPIPDEWDLAK